MIVRTVVPTLLAFCYFYYSVASLLARLILLSISLFFSSYLPTMYLIYTTLLHYHQRTTYSRTNIYQGDKKNWPKPRTNYSAFFYFTLPPTATALTPQLPLLRHLSNDWMPSSHVVLISLIFSFSLLSRRHQILHFLMRLLPVAWPSSYCTCLATVGLKNMTKREKSYTP